MNRDSANLADAAGSGEHRLVSAALAQLESIAAERSGPTRLPHSLTVPGYRILGEIHRGGQGVVYQAIQESTRRKMAVKVLKEGPFADTPELARFQREVDVLSRLKHPHVVTIHDCGLTAGHAYYIMDYVAGRPLDAYVASAQLTVEETLDLFLKVCDAVSFAHLRGIIHRDLKPGNILVTDEGEGDQGGSLNDRRSDEGERTHPGFPPSVASSLRRPVAYSAQPKILDFGLAKWLTEMSGPEQTPDVGSSLSLPHSALRTMTGHFIGSLPWSSPEQVGGRPDSLDIRTDVYSLGVILYQLLTGRFPYPVAGRVDEVTRHIVQTTPARLSAPRRKVELDVELIVLKCLAKEPQRRYQSAGELARDIRHFLAHEPITATSPSAGYRLLKFVRRHRAAVITGAIVALALVIATGVSIQFALSESRQRKNAEISRGRAKEAEAQAQTRAVELEQMARFHEAQLSGIDAQTMGTRFRAGLLANARAAAERSELPPETVDAQIAKLETLIAGSDFTGLALESLGDNFFEPALAAIESEFPGQPLMKARLLHTLASTLMELGMLELASEPQQQALEIRRQNLGDEHPDTLASMHSMGLLLQEQGDLAGAELFLREVLEKRRLLLGEEDPVTLNSINNFGVLLWAQGRLAEAEQYLREALEKYRRVLAEDHADVLMSINNLGGLLHTQGRLAEAEPFYLEALAMRRRVLGEEHPDTLMSITNMAGLLQSQGKFAEAGPFFQEVLEKRRRIAGDEHPDTLRAINNIAVLYHAQGRFSEAEPFFREALETRRRVLGDEHPQTINSINNMGGLLKAEGKLKEAEELHREALEKHRRVVGEEHPDTLISINNLGSVLEAEGKLAEAEPYYREALQKSRRLLGEDHPDTFYSINNMAGLLKRQSRFTEAEPLFREALEKRRRILGEEHPDTIVSIKNLGSLFEAQGRLAEAERFYREALEKRIRVLGGEHPSTLISITNMGSLLLAQNKPAEALELLAPAEPLTRRAFTGGNVVRLGRFLTLLGRARVAAGEFAAAEEALSESYTILSETAAETEQHPTEVMTAMVELYDAWHESEPDGGYDSKASEIRTALRTSVASTQPEDP